MSRWLDQVDGLLYDGEEIAARIEIGGGGVIVTSHRVMVFTPETSGANFEYVDRPNVSGVSRGTDGNMQVLMTAIQAVVVGAILLVAGTFVSLDSLVGGISLGGGAGSVGLGGMLGMMQTLLNLLAMLDEILTLFGALALLLGTLLLGIYAQSREELLVFDVAGDEDLSIPGVDVDLDVDLDELVDQLDRAVRPDPTPGPSGESTANSSAKSAPAQTSDRTAASVAEAAKQEAAGSGKSDERRGDRREDERGPLS